MFDFGKIVLVRFPFSDLTSSKLRPALVVSKASRGDDIIVCVITSAAQPTWRSVPIENNEETGLKLQSVVRFDKIATLNKRVVFGEIGQASSSWLQNNKDKFFAVFGF